MRRTSKIWLEHYAIESGPQPHELSRIAQMALSENAPHVCTFAVCKFVAPLPQSSAERIQWDRVSLDAQELVMSLEHLSLIDEHYWCIEGVIQHIGSVHEKRGRHREDAGLLLFEKGMPAVAYYNTRSGEGWMGIDPASTIVRPHLNYGVEFTTRSADPKVGISLHAKIVKRPEPQKSVTSPECV